MRIRYVMAFATVASTLFFLTTLIWPISVVKFRSLAVINANIQLPVTLDATNSKAVQQEAMRILVDCVRHEATEANLDELLSLVREQEPLVSPDFEYRDFASISSGIQVGIDLESDDGSIKYVISYDGYGRKDEQRFLGLLSKRVAKRLALVSMNNQGGLVFDLPSEKIDRAIWIANQIESDLSEVANRFNSKSRSSFQLASSSKDNRNSSNSEDIAGTLGSIETGQLKLLLNDIKSMETDSMDRLLVVNRIGDVSTDAVGSAPGWIPSILLSILAMSIAGVVTMHYDPFGARGFDSIDSIGSRLGLPIVATLKNPTEASPSTEETQNNEHIWANHLVEASTVILLAAMAVTVGFVLLDTTVRESFFYHPYDGLTRIVQIFMGY